MKIKVIAKYPGENPHVTSMSNRLENLQKYVGGYIEAVAFPTGIVVICNEEGKIRNLPPNGIVGGIEFVGNIIFAGVQGEEFGDIPVDYQTFKKLYSNLFTHE